MIDDGPDHGVLNLSVILIDADFVPGPEVPYNLAEPEKALLDWIYFKSEGGLPIEMDEFHIDGLDRNRLLEGAREFSAPVRNRIVSLLAEAPHAVLESAP